MENKNVIAAISLSAAVIILYSLFFQPDPEVVKKNLAKQSNEVSNTDTPSLEKNENFIKLSREEALKENVTNHDPFSDRALNYAHEILKKSD